MLLIPEKKTQHEGSSLLIPGQSLLNLLYLMLRFLRLDVCVCNKILAWRVRKAPEAKLLVAFCTNMDLKKRLKAPTFTLNANASEAQLKSHLSATDITRYIK